MMSALIKHFDDEFKKNKKHRKLWRNGGRRAAEQHLTGRARYSMAPSMAFQKSRLCIVPTNEERILAAEELA
jgi:hypothetical protein